MIVVDARSGREVAVGETVRYPGDPGADWQLLGVESANPFGDAVIVIRRLCDNTTHRVPCPVRWFVGSHVLPVIVAPT